MNSKEYVEYHLCVLDDYINNVLTKKILVGKYERLLVERFIEHKNKYIYKESELRRILKFFSLLQIPIKNDTKQLRVMPFQMLWLASFFAIYKTETQRLYTLAYILCAKKNNKTTFTAAIAIYVTIAYNILNAHTLMVAASREQARTLINAVEFIIKNSPAITSLFRVNKNIIYNKTAKTNNKIEIRSSDAGKINGVGQGVFLSVVDEFSYHENGYLQQNLKSAQAFNDNHLQIIIGTASQDLENPSFSFYESAKNIMNKLVENDSIFIAIYELDKKEYYKEKKYWRQPNPALNETISEQALESELKMTEALPSQLETVLTHHFNIWTDHITESFIEDDIIKDILKENRQIEKGKSVWIGVDMSSLNDLSAVSVLSYDEQNDIFIAKIYHIFPNNEKRRIKQGSVDLAKWFITEENPHGCVIRCESKSLDENIIIELLSEINRNYRIQGFYYDPFNARILANRIENELGINTYEVRQNYTMSFPIKFIEKYITERKLFLDKNDCTRWQFRNVRIKTDRNNNYLITKKQGESVDGIVALSCAMYGFLNDNYSSFANTLSWFSE